jgi:hypothetical protein
MAKYRLNLSFDIDITADEDSEVSEEEMVDMLQKLYYNDRKEFIEALTYCFEEEKVAYHVTIKPQKIYTDVRRIMFNINFDLFYELKQGSVVSNTNENVVKYWRVVNDNLEVKTVIDNHTENDWQVSDLFELSVNGKFKIEERFERFSNG